MGTFSDNIAFNTRLYSAISAVIAIGLIALWAFLGNSPVIKSETVYATVIETGTRQVSGNTRHLKLKLANNKELKTFSVINPVPIAGDRIPLVLETYENGEQQYYIDHARWKEEQLLK